MEHSETSLYKELMHNGASQQESVENVKAKAAIAGFTCH